MSSLLPVGSLERLFELRDEEKVRAFLAEEPEVLDLFLDLHTHVVEFFPQPVRLALEVFEWGSCPILFAIVVCGCPRLEADSYFEQLDREWWNERCEAFYEKVGLDMEYGR